MIDPYIRPQETITQILQPTASPTASRRNPLIVGPQYELFLDDGKLLPMTKFSAAGGSLTYKDLDGVELDDRFYTPDTDTAELKGSGLLAEVADFVSDAWSIDVDNLRHLRVGSDSVAGTGDLNASLLGRSVRVGDVFDFSTDVGGNNGPVQFRRTVVGLLGKNTAASTSVSLPVSYAQENAAADATAITATSSRNFSAVSYSGDVDVDDSLLTAGKVYVNPTDGNRYLGDIVKFAYDGSAWTVSSDAVGNSSAIVPSGTPTELVFDIATIYGGGFSGAEVTIDIATAPSSGEEFNVLIAPVFATAQPGDVTTFGAYNGPSDRVYVLEMTSQTTYRVYSQDGAVASTSNPDHTALFSVSGGLQIVLNASGHQFYTGQKILISATAARVSTSDFDGVVLDGPTINGADWEAADTNAKAATVVTDLIIYQRYSGTLKGEDFTAGLGESSTYDGTVNYVAGLGLPASITRLNVGTFALFKNGEGDVYVSYKAVKLPSDLEGPIRITTPSQRLKEVGEDNVENWLGRGTAEALSGNQGTVAYALRTAGDTVEAFAEALAKIEASDNFYAIAPMTDLIEVQELVRDHVESMSSPVKRNFRRAYVGTDSPGSYVYWGNLPGGGYRQATILDGILTIEEADRSVSVFTNDDIGASVEVLALGQSYTITAVVNTYEVRLDIDIDLVVSPSSNITMTRPDTPAATAAYVIARSNTLNSRRVANIWSDNPTTLSASGDVQVLPAKFIAAEVAGLRCAILPQQGITHWELESVSAAPGMYARFSQEQLDAIAANGTMVVTQESEGGEMFIRHQLTTKAESFAALEYEDSVGVVVDEFSYAEKDSFRGYIGRRNVTPGLFFDIRNQLINLGVEFSTTSSAESRIGPRILTFFDEEGNEGRATVRQDGDLADSVLTYVKLRVPLPLNKLNHYVDVEAPVLVTEG